jgi:hypothetical protein
LAEESLTKAADFKVVAEGPVACIRLSPEALGHFQSVLDGKDELSKRRKVRLQRIFREFCENARPQLNDEQFKKEGDFPNGLGKTVAVIAIKAWQFRLYGTVCMVGNKKCFVGVKVDPAKKQDRANQRLLKATAREFGGIDETKGQIQQQNGAKDDQKARKNRGRR